MGNEESEPPRSRTPTPNQQQTSSVQSKRNPNAEKYAPAQNNDENEAEGEGEGEGEEVNDYAIRKKPKNLNPQNTQSPQISLPRTPTPQPGSIKTSIQPEPPKNAPPQIRRPPGPVRRKLEETEKQRELEMKQKITESILKNQANHAKQEIINNANNENNTNSNENQVSQVKNNSNRIRDSINKERTPQKIEINRPPKLISKTEKDKSDINKNQELFDIRQENRIKEKLRNYKGGDAAAQINELLLKNRQKLDTSPLARPVKNMEFIKTPETYVEVPVQTENPNRFNEEIRISKREFKFPTIRPKQKNESPNPRHSYQINEIPSLQQNNNLLEETASECLGFSKFEHQSASLMKLNFPEPANTVVTRKILPIEKIQGELPPIEKNNKSAIFNNKISDDLNLVEPPSVKALVKNPLSVFLKNIDQPKTKPSIENLFERNKSIDMTPQAKSRQGNLHGMSSYAPYIIKSILENHTPDYKNRNSSVLKERNPKNHPYINQTLNATINIGEINEYPYGN